MRKFRKKQKNNFKIMKTLIIFSVIFILIYIGAQPYIASFNNIVDIVIKYFCDALIIANLVVIFSYYNKYGKCDAFLESIENELSDAGYYITSRNENDIDSYVDVIFNDLKENGYSVDKNYDSRDFTFSVRGIKRKEFFYVAKIEDVDKNDILAYLDDVINDITVKNIKRKGDAVVCFITDNAQDDAIALSKMITPIGKKAQLKIALSIVEPETKKVFFLGNVQTKCSRMIANFVMNCDLPIKEKYIHSDKLPFQYELEEKMKSFNIKDFKNGNFYAH